MTTCKICKSITHGTSQCNMIDYYTSMISRLFLDYRRDQDRENLQSRMKETTKYWKNEIWMSVAKVLHHKLGAYVSINTTIRFIRHLRCTLKSSYVDSFCTYYHIIESDIQEENINRFNYKLCMTENDTQWYANEVCGICLEENHENKTIALPCNHTYCVDCVLQLVINKTTSCPECRDQFNTLYFCKNINWEKFNKLQHGISSQ